MSITALKAGARSLPSRHHMLYTEKHMEIRRELRKDIFSFQFIDRSINPHVKKWEDDCRFPAHAVFKRIGNLGVLAVNKPEGSFMHSITAFGGLGLDFSYSVAVAEELGSIDCAAIPMAVCVQTNMATPALAEFGSDSLRSEFLAPSIAGDLVACIAVSEPEAGSDVAAIRTKALRSGSDLIINGHKMWITNGYQNGTSASISLPYFFRLQADWACVLVNSNNNPSPHRNKSLVCVRLNEPGHSNKKGKEQMGANEQRTEKRLNCFKGQKSVHRTANLKKLGMHCSDTAEIFFDNVRVGKIELFFKVPARHIIGEEGQGFYYQMLQFQDERLVAAAVLLEPIQRCITLTANYAAERKIFGSTVLNQQTVHFTLAELQSELEAVRSLLYRAVLSRIHGDDVTLLASMTKLKAGRLARIVTDSCLQFWGGNGFTWENPVCRMHRDLRLHSVGAGADEVMLSIICKQMGIAPQKHRS
ncbi:unnamed protein product [Angiostrongylus costaricensis]|uniref:Acyl-CoA dehydrogenase 6 n=1 Tax=Angiostrongylus costaricensis TaxID=334426 RepID=A0A0R3PRS8_ANGCS|nr:unnamed protein product [Angiostrongylus costaricensis]